MNRLFQHIEYLLLRHDCVIVPGLGAFIASRQPARIDMESGEILPPSRTVMFNQAVSVDDGLLASSFARKSSLDFDEARQVILRHVSAYKNSLSQNRMAKAGNLGTFLLGEENNLVFTPGVKLMAPSRMGFSSVKMALPKVEETPIKESAENIEDQDSDSSKYYSFRISKAFTRIAAACLVVAAVAISVILNPIPHDSRVEQASVVPVEVLMPNRHEVKPVETVAKDTVKFAQPVLPSHYLIVATFSSNKEAEEYATKYSTKEYPLTAVASRKLCRVAAAASDSRDSLRMKLNSREFSSKFPNSWIWSR